MKGWMKEEKTMITCCSDGTRPVIFKIERIDYDTTTEAVKAMLEKQAVDLQNGR